MVKYLICFLLLSVPAMAICQGHESKLPGCKLYVDPPRPPGRAARATAIDGPVCMACRKEKQDKYDAEKAETERKSAALREQLEKEEQERKAKVKAVEDKNLADLNTLNALKASVAAQEAIDDKYKQQRYAAERRRKELDDKANSDYAALLDKIQAAESQPATTTDDDFWNETILPANYLPIQNKAGLWGFTNKQGRQTIDYQYYWATAFSKGAALVRLNDKEKNYALIDTKGKLIREFDEAFFNTAGKGGTKITGFSYRSFTDGMLVVDFNTSDYSNRNTFGCINRKGEIVIPPSFASIDSFKNGTAKAKKLYNKDDDKIEWEYSGEFTASYRYYDFGVIDQVGDWLAPARKKMEYSSRFYEPGYITLSDPNDKRSYAEKEAERIRYKQIWNAAYDQKMDQLNARVATKVNAAKAQGMLTEKL
jgi:chemotaxis protein histidine kinase CheA